MKRISANFGFLQIKQNWQNLVLNKIFQKMMNLTDAFKRWLALKAQEQIIKNYHMVLEFKNTKPKSVLNELPKLKRKKKFNKWKTQEFIKIYSVTWSMFGNPGNAGSGLAIYSNKRKSCSTIWSLRRGNKYCRVNVLHQALVISQNKQVKISSLFLDSKICYWLYYNLAYSWKKKWLE